MSKYTEAGKSTTTGFQWKPDTGHLEPAFPGVSDTLLLSDFQPHLCHTHCFPLTKGIKGITKQLILREPRT